MKQALKQLGSESDVFGSKPAKKMSTYRIDDETKKLADLVVVTRSLMNGNRVESYTKLIKNLIKEEWIRIKNDIAFNDLLKDS
jgi:hypothetical protein